VTAPTAFDLVVIGTGAGGFGPAMKCSQAGWRVAVVDDQPFGGTCALRGCDPKKVLVQAAQLVDWHRRMSANGVTGEARLDWPMLMRFKRSFTDPVPDRRERALRDAGAVTLHGESRFTAANRLSVGDADLQGNHFVIAAGARPAPLSIPGEEHVRTSTEFLELDQLPARIAFIGAGYISFEFAHISQRAGTSATILGRGAPLSRFDEDLVKPLVQLTRELGVDVRLDRAVTAVERTGEVFRVCVKGVGGPEVIVADYVVHGAGRVPNTAGLALDAADVRADARNSVVVNEFLQSVSNPRVYAAGDVTLPAGSMPLTPVGGMEGAVVASNLLKGNYRKPDYRGIPSVVFTIPPLASVGFTEAQARLEGLDVQVYSADTKAWYSSRSVASQYGMFKTVVESSTDRVIGAHVLGVHAEEIINVFAIAVRHGLTSHDLRHLIYAYPTSGSEIPYMLE
jgi:glutathione reductase (NADPH)